jgi:hypothetical protein
MSLARVGWTSGMYTIWHSGMSNRESSLENILMPSMHWMESIFYNSWSLSSLSFNSASSCSSSLTSIGACSGDLGYEEASLDFFYCIDWDVAITSTLQYNFYDEYMQHIENENCGKYPICDPWMQFKIQIGDFEVSNLRGACILTREESQNKVNKDPLVQKMSSSKNIRDI